MYQIFNLINSPNVTLLEKAGPFTVIEHQQQQSVEPDRAQEVYFASKVNIRQRQLVCSIDEQGVAIQPGLMQWMVGNVQATTGLKGVTDLIGKFTRSKFTGESMIKPEYTGHGLLVLEPTWKHILLLNLDEWNGAVVLDDGLFLACQGNIEQKVAARSNLSSAVAGNEGLFSLALRGSGIIALAAPCPRSELVEVVLDNDILKVDGNLAIAWSQSLRFTVERSSKSLVGSAVNDEGLVNVFQGSGRVLLAGLLDEMVRQDPDS